MRALSVSGAVRAPLARPLLGLVLAVASTAVAVGPPDASAGVASRTQAARTLQASLGLQGLVTLDRRVSTPRVIARLDGYLTQPTRGDPATIVLDYVRRHHGIFGLNPGELDRLRITKRYVSSRRVVHLTWVQTVRGIPVLDGGLSANVTTDGRIVNIVGAPFPEVPSAPAEIRSRRVQAHRPAADARLVVVERRDKAHLAWRAVVRGADGVAYDTLVDATSGDVLRRRSLSRYADALVFDHYPGAPTGGTQRRVDITRYVSDPGGTALFGDYAFVFANVDADEVVDDGEQIAPSSGVDYTYPYTPFPIVAGVACPPAPVYCSWNPNVPYSWETNREQAAVQAFWFVNRFHDHLAGPPIEFTPVKGSFEGDDRVWIAAESGADTANGLPAVEQLNNAFMNVPPEGPPLLTLRLFRPIRDLAFGALNAADDATVVYHEYTHGLIARLVVDPLGFHAMEGAQPLALHEGLADWYALDFLAKEGYVVDVTAPGQVKVGDYLGPTADPWRTQALDCSVAAPAAACPGTPSAGTGGYTYGDYGLIS